MSRTWTDRLAKEIKPRIRDVRWAWEPIWHFTTEIHSFFQYSGGETFTFQGDDDVWVFINKKLVIDLGGVHGVSTQSVNLDSLGLEPGNVYPIEVFHAERHTVQSNFRIDTTICSIPQ